MSYLARLRSWIRAAVGRNDLERRMQMEMQTHLELYEADLRRRGLSAAAAHRRARAEFGSVDARKDECRDARGLRLLGEIRGDVTYAARLLRRSPGFAFVALFSLALGIGANTAIFSLIDTVLMKRLPVRDPASLVFVDTTGGRSGGTSGPPYPLYELLRDRNQSLAGMAAFSESLFKVTIDGTAEQVRGQFASGSYFDLLGVRAAHGRLLTPSDDSEFARGGPDGPVGVISYNLWRQRFAMDPAVLGRSIQVGSDWVTIVGVTPPEFFGLQVGTPIDLTIPMMLAGRQLRATGSWWMHAVGRIRSGATAEQARAELDGLYGPYMDEHGMRNLRHGHFSGIALVPASRGLNELRRQFSEPLLIVMAIVAVVLLIGCANVANLLLARASARRSEMSVRLAIGASRARLIRQLLTEGAVLVFVGSLAGLLVAQTGVSFLVSLFGNRGGGILLEPPFDLRVLAFTAGVAVITVVLFSIAPALHATRVDAAKPGDTNTSLTRPRVRLGQSLVVLQVTLAVALLCGAALFLRTLHNLNSTDVGFRRDGVLTMQVEATVAPLPVTSTADERRKEYARLGAIWEELTARVGALPGVTSAAIATLSPLTGRDRGVGIAIQGITLPENQRGVHVNQVTSGYFDTLGIPVVSGRGFTPQDRAGSLRVAILNDTAARANFPGVSPLGRRINFPGQRVEDQFEIVGVVRDVRYVSLRRPDEGMAYIPIEQAIDPLTNVMALARSDRDSMLLVPLIRSAAREAVPGGFVTRIGLMEERVERSLLRERLLSMLATFFGGLALALACIGLYGVMAYAVVRRTREIGIRIAVGARHTSVIWMMVRETLVLVVAGIALGTVAAIAASRYVSAQLFGVTPGDPLATGAAIALLLGVTLAAAYVPARRASRIDPVVALRYE
jgi:predicted permease